MVEKIVAALGALMTHQLAYLVASLLDGGAPSLSDHGHLPLQWAVVAPLAVGAAAGFVVWQLRGLGFRSSIRVRHLGALVTGFFLLQELIEGLSAGRSPIEVAAHPALAAGVVLGPLVAWVMSRALAGATELAARLLARTESPIPATRAGLVTVSVGPAANCAHRPSRPRAPPSPLRI